MPSVHTRECRFLPDLSRAVHSQPIRIHRAVAEQTARFHAREVLALSKMNWNKTQFDGRDPITVRAARQVSRILKYTTDEQPFQTRSAILSQVHRAERADMIIG